MKRRTLLGLTLALVALPAMAEDMLVEQRDGARACWQRLYDPAHLASHPDQQVVQMTFGIAFHGLGKDQPALHMFVLDAGLRDGRRGHASGSCTQEASGSMHCQVECDGGAISVRLDGNGSVLADLESTGFVRLEGECGHGGEGETGFDLLPGKDDKLFRLDRTDPRQCEGFVPFW